MRLFILICVCLVLAESCIGTKKTSSYKINPENLGASRASSLAKDGITSYLIVPLADNKYAIATNYAICGVILDGRFNGQQCSDAINQFYQTEKSLDLTDILDIAYFDVIDTNLLKLYSLKGVHTLVNQMYDSNCIPITEGILSHSSVKAAALITMGVDLVQTQYNEYELSTAACEIYRKSN